MSLADRQSRPPVFSYGRVLFESLPLGVVVQDASGSITEANAAAEAILGLSQGQLRGVTSLDPRWCAVHEDGTAWPGNEHPAMQSLQTQKPVLDQVMGVFNPHLNRLAWIKVSANPIWSQTGDTVEAVYSVFEDITARRQLETELLEKQLQYRLAIETSTDGFLATDTAGRIIEVNDAYVRQCGYSHDELLGMAITDLEAKEDSAETHEHIRKAMQMGHDLFESLHRRKDASVWPVEVAMNYSAAEGGRFFAFLRDISKRRLYEAQTRQFEAIVQSSQDAIIGNALDGTVSGWSAGAHAMFGYLAQEMLGGSESAIFPAALQQQEAQAIESLQRGERVRHFETVRIKKDGTEIKVSVNISPIRDGEGKVTGVSKIVRDITERVRNDAIQSARLRLMGYATNHTLKELLVATLDEAGLLTGSPIGFYHFLEPDQTTLTLQAWSTRTTQEYCTAEGEGRHYNTGAAGVWVDCIRLRKPVIHNDYADLPNKHGLPPGHASVIREMVVPVFRQNLIVAILGVGNKPTRYTEFDLEAVALLADLAWDFAESKRADEALRNSEERFRQAMEATSDGLWDWTIPDGTGYFSPAYFRMLGYDPGEFSMTAQSWIDRIHPDDVTRVLANNNDCIENRRQSFEVEYRMRTKDGGWKWVLGRGKAFSRDARGRAQRMIGTHADINERKETDLQINFLAYHDQLTALPNRMLFFDRFSQAISLAKRHEKLVALLFLDLDGFKAVNDTHGHDAGDIVLRFVADRLTACVRSMDTVARLGGDEFAIALGELEDPIEASAVAAKLLLAVAQGIQVSNQVEVFVQASIGISVYPDNGSEMDVLLAQADSAMYQSKERGKNRFTFWAEARPTHSAEDIWIEMGAEQLVGFSEIDDQHHEIVRLVNELNASIRAKRNSEEVTLQFANLTEYTKFHFASEQRLMEEYNYPGRKSHAMAHGHLLLDVLRFNAMLNQGGDLFVLQSIKDWLLRHIQSQDKALGAFLQLQSRE